MQYVTLTKDALVDLDACVDDVDLFKRVFPSGARPTWYSIRRAHDHGLDVFWLMYEMAPERMVDAYFLLRREHRYLLRTGAISPRQYAMQDLRLKLDALRSVWPVANPMRRPR